MKQHTFEPELDQPCPRPVQRRGGVGEGCGLWFIRLFILPHTLVGLGLLLAAPAHTLINLGVWLFGVDQEGQVLRADESFSNKSQKKSYSLSYAFTVHGVEYKGSTSLTAAEYVAFKKDQARLQVRVLTWLPSYGHWPLVEGYSPVWNVLGFWFMALFWNGILSVFVWQVYYRPWVHWRLARYGVPTSGLVREVKAGRGKGGMHYRIRYEYVGPVQERDEVLHGAVTVNGALGSGVQVGDVLTVLYDPRRPKRSLPYKLGDFAVTAAAHGNEA